MAKHKIQVVVSDEEEATASSLAGDGFSALMLAAACKARNDITGFAHWISEAARIEGRTPEEIEFDFNRSFRDLRKAT